MSFYEKRDREGGKEGKKKMKIKKERMSSLISNSICGYSCP